MAAFPLILPGTSRPPKLVVFDLDHTLIACDATILWTEFLYEKKIVTDPIWRQYDRDMVKSYAKGVLDIRDFCRKHAGAFRSIPEEKLHALAQEFAKKKIAPLIFPDGKKWVKNALQANIPACVLSASAAFIVKPIAKLFGLTDAMGIELAFKDGFCTGEIVGIPTFQEGKVERLSQRLTEAGIGFEDVLFFTDSRNDLPLAERAGYTVCVNPDAVLESAARKNGWKVAEWKLSLRTQMTAQVDAKGVPETQTVRS